jgi:hypothetical protein
MSWVIRLAQQLIDLDIRQAWQYPSMHFRRIHIHYWVLFHHPVPDHPIAQHPERPEIRMLAVLALQPRKEFIDSFCGQLHPDCLTQTGVVESTSELG